MSAFADSDTPGRLLAAARVPIAALEAIDADDHRAIAAPVYVRGFVRLYAREVGLDPGAVVALLDKATADAMVSRAREPALPEAAPQPRRSRSRALYSVAGVALIAGLLLVLFSVSSGPAERELAPEPDAAAPQVVPLPVQIIGVEAPPAEGSGETP